MTNLPIAQLQGIFGERLQENVQMTNYNTTRVGGPVTGLISINSAKEM